MEKQLIQKSTLYIVATPIGNLGDFSERAINTLKQVDFIAAEDTRHSSRLLKYFDITTPMIALHEHNEQERSQKILHLLSQGNSIALISDAGTPLISDPGFRLVHEARLQNYDVIPIPGACAAIAALSAAGLPSDRFIFEGFLSAKKHGRIQRLEELKNESRTLIFYESPHRILFMLEDMLSVFGEERYVVIARELTKLYETIHGDCLIDLYEWIKNNSDQQQGEFVVLVEGLQKSENVDEEDIRILKILLEDLSVKQASHLASQITGKRKNALYQLALEHTQHNQR